MADEKPLRSLESLIGKTVRGVWVSDVDLILDFEDGTTLQIEADEGELRVYFGEANTE